MAEKKQGKGKEQGRDAGRDTKPSGGGCNS
jgi:hypothetical protein